MVSNLAQRRADIFCGWFAEGRIPSDALIWCEGWSDWQVAQRSLAQFYSQAKSQQVSPPPVPPPSVTDPTGSLAIHGEQSLQIGANVELDSYAWEDWSDSDGKEAASKAKLLFDGCSALCSFARHDCRIGFCTCVPHLRST